ncbi:MAG TPA: hypothetical protein VHU40_02205 [Polyangia bacterium]|jgi:heme/copper-type cytochrome/quinol oxidase subunit 3|nr:hypothetical protein [Polyangia bacterium]
MNTGRVAAGDEWPLDDVSVLPGYAFGTRSPVVWGAALLVAIESTMMGLLLVSEIYLRGNQQAWPHLAFPRKVVGIAVVELALLLGSLVPAALSARAARREQVERSRSSLIAATVLGVMMLVVRGYLFGHLPFRWDEHALGSVFWTALVLHTTHVFAGVAEYGVLIALLFRGPVEKKNFVDVEASWVLWAFSVLEWIPATVLLYGAGQ